MVGDPRKLLLAAVLLLGACFIGRRSDEFACESPTDCDSGFTCVQGFCVPPTCPAGCTSCTTLKPDGSGYADCKIDCNGNQCRNTTVTCPVGMACTIVCDNNSDCQRVDCTGAASCTVQCTGTSSCQTVTCGAGPCSVTCSGTQSCSSGVTCDDSCKCDVLCGGTNACSTPATCPATTCDTGTGCSSSNAACNTCPAQ